MNHYVAFMRAINVAGHASMRMSGIRDGFAAAGCRKVRTYIQSGNVIFESPARDAAGTLRKVRGRLRNLLDDEPEIVFRTVREIEDLVKRAAFKDVQAEPGIKQAYPFDGGDGADLAIAGDRVYVSLYNGNKIVVYRQVPDTDCDPDFAVGAPDICTNTLDTNYFVTNGVPASNGRNLFVSSDFDRRLYVWKNLPGESGAHPDLVYRLPEAPWDNALYGDRLVLAGQRTAYVWNRLPLAGELPDVTFKDSIGGAQFTQLRGVALDGRYFYLSDESGKVWVWEGLPSATQDPIATLSIAAPRRLNSDGTHFVVTQTDPPRILVYRVADLATNANPTLTLANDSPGLGPTKVGPYDLQYVTVIAKWTSKCSIPSRGPFAPLDRRPRIQ